METKSKNEMIADAIKENNWKDVDELITRKDLYNYMLSQTLPQLSENGDKVLQLDEDSKCPLCSAKLKGYRVSLTARAAYYVMSLNYLVNDDLKNGGDGYINYDLVKMFCEEKFGIKFTSYGYLTKEPYAFITPRFDSNNKLIRDGHFTITDKGLAFIRGQINVPDHVIILNNEVIEVSKTYVSVRELKKMNFRETLEIYKSF